MPHALDDPRAYHKMQGGEGLLFEESEQGRRGRLRPIVERERDLASGHVDDADDRRLSARFTLGWPEVEMDALISRVTRCARPGAETRRVGGVWFGGSRIGRKGAGMICCDGPSGNKLRVLFVVILASASPSSSSLRDPATYHSGVVFGHPGSLGRGPRYVRRGVLGTGCLTLEELVDGVLDRKGGRADVARRQERGLGMVVRAMGEGSDGERENEGGGERCKERHGGRFLSS